MKLINLTEITKYNEMTKNEMTKNEMIKNELNIIYFFKLHNFRAITQFTRVRIWAKQHFIFL